MALSNFVPKIWAAEILTNVHKDLVYGDDYIINTDYEGDIEAFGDEVKINSVGPITVEDYVKNSDMSSPQELDSAQQTLKIDRAKSFNFQIDAIDQAQTKPKVEDEAMSEAGYAIADVIDRDIASLYVDVAAANIVGLGNDTTPLVPTATTMYEILADMYTRLSEANVQKMNRFVVLPPWCTGLLRKDDRFVKAGTMRTDEVLRTGEIGEAAGFKVFESNNVPNTSDTKYKVIAGVRKAWSFAGQVVRVRQYEPEKRHADAVKGLYVYGRKLIRPDHIAVATLNKS